MKLELFPNPQLFELFMDQIIVIYFMDPIRILWCGFMFCAKMMVEAYQILS